jgi:hypothetical protein
MKLKLDLHDIYNRGADIDRAVRAIIDETAAKHAPLVEIIPGKGSGQLKKRVLRFLDKKETKGPVSPGGEGLRQLRPDLRPLPVERTGQLATGRVSARPLDPVLTVTTVDVNPPRFLTVGRP